MDYRHEIKHIITPGDARAIEANMRAVARSDPHTRSDGSYLIRSLYFDDYRDTALHEKLDGINERRKYRIRYYNDDLSYIMLECKIKEDGVGCKPQARMSYEEVEKLLHGDTDWMRFSRQPLIVNLYVEMKTRLLRPKTVVAYERIPFIYDPGNVRVTIDWNVRTGPPRDFLNPHGLTIPIEDHCMILEVKWDEYLPNIIREATALKSRGASAFSKYAACRVYS